MSVDTTHISQSFAMDGHTANFSFTFACLQSEPSSVKIRKLNSVNANTYSTLVYNVDYTVAVNAGGSGGIVTVVDTAGTDTLFLYRETTDKQETNYTDYNQFPADTLEHDLDRRTMRSQEDNDGVSRAVKFSASSSISGITLPSPVNRTCLVWSGGTGQIVNSVYDPDSMATIAISAQTIAMSAATAAGISQLGAEAARTTAQNASYTSQTYSSVSNTWASIAETWASIAQSAANTALGASSFSTIHYISTAAYINVANITQATITGLTVDTINITNMDTVTVGSMTVLTTANIASLFAALFSATTANITGLTVGTLNITDMDTVTVGSITVTTSATIAGGSATFGTLTIPTGMTASMVDAAALTAGQLLVTTNATLAMATATALTVTTINISSGTIAKEVNIAIATTGATPTWTKQADFNKLFGSAGRASGGEILSAGTDTISVATGTGFIKATDSDTATLLSFDWPSASSITVLTNTTTYVYIDFNGGIPTIATTTVDGAWDLDTSFPLGSVVQELGVCHILNNPWWVTDGMTNLIERSDARALIFRDVNVGGLILSSTADRRIAVTAGKLWSRLNEISVSALATNSTFEVYWRTSSTIWTETDVSTLSTVSYNDLNTNTLTAIDNNKYVNWWVYAEADDSEIALVYPQAQYNSAAEAEAVGSPSVLPKHIEEHGILIGRIIMKQGVTAPVETQSAFSTVFAASASADHGNLTGLADDDHTQYLLTSGTRSQGTLNVATSATIAFLAATTANITNLTVDTVTVGSITVTTNATIAALNVSGASQLNTAVVTMATITSLTVSTITGHHNGTLSGNVTSGNLSVATSATIASAVITSATVTGLTATTVNITGGFATSLSIATLSNVTAATIGLLTATTITVGGSLVQPDIVKSVTIESPTTADSITLFKVPSAATINAMYAVVTGTSPSATWVIKHGTDRSGGGDSVLTAGTTTTDLTTGSTVTAFSDATIVANSWVWAVFPAVTGTVSSLNITLKYRMDA